MKKHIKPEMKFVVCITDSEPDLEPRKVYQVIQDEAADKENHLRVIDESGEDYLYPADFFCLSGSPEGSGAGAAPCFMTPVLEPLPLHAPSF